MKMDQVIGSQVNEALPTNATNLPDNLSPQCIGREFVRCYYTLLHDNPNKLHRFYLDQSTFVHGNQTDETAECVSGQRAIHEKIMSLKFEDCRTKIKHVDSQATIDDGVVVQVSGELSNAGQLPRRFMQTFVLGSQTPRKYYVHNDIFRYQDEVFGYGQEDTCEDEVDSLSSQEEVNDTVDEDSPPTPQVYDEKEIEPTMTFEEQPNGNMIGNPILNNHTDLPESHNDFDQVLDDAIPAEVDPILEPAEVIALEPEYAHADEPEDIPVPEEVLPVSEPEIHEEYIEPEPEVPKGPKSWAMIAGGNSHSTARTVTQPKPAPVQSKPTPEPKEPAHKKDTSFQPFHKENDIARTESRGSRRGTKEYTRDRGFSNTRDRFQERDAPNAHQIFVGNLPNNTGQAELDSAFMKYGKVVHVRVTPNNFGFVVFENEDPVQEILSAVRSGEKFFLNDQRLNVEEKKTVMNNNRGPRKPFTDQRGGPRRGGRRGGGSGGGLGRSYNDHNSDIK